MTKPSIETIHEFIERSPRFSPDKEAISHHDLGDFERFAQEHFAYYDLPSSERGPEPVPPSGVRYHDALFLGRMVMGDADAESLLKDLKGE